MQTLIYNATLVLPDRVVEHGWLLIEDGRILDLGEEATFPGYPVSQAQSIDADNNFVLPGLIDLHCDAIEKLVEPRPNVHFNIRTALQEADLRLAGSGITCEFHAVSLDDNEFGVRSDTFVHELCQAIEELGDESLIHHKIHARLELSSERGSDIIARMIERRECDLVSLMDHSPGQGQYRSVQAFREYVVRTTGRSIEEVDGIVEMKRIQMVNVPARIERITRQAREAGLAIATHDDDTVAKVEQWPVLGVSVSEFPTTSEAARRAHEMGLTVCMGAPNVLRGKSSGGNLSALAAIQADIADALCSDYYPAAMLGALFRLVKLGIVTLPAAARLVTLHPAQAVGLDKLIGSLEAGKDADVILVKLMPGGIPRVLQVFVGGDEKLRTRF